MLDVVIPCDALHIGKLRHSCYLTSSLADPVAAHPEDAARRSARRQGRREGEEDGVRCLPLFVRACVCSVSHSAVPDILNQALVLDPQHRMSAGDALKHAFLNDS
jgi:hypothetical protein